MAEELQEFDTISVDQLDPIILALEQYLSVANVNGKLFKSTIGDLVTFAAPFISAVGSSGLVFPSATNVLPNPTTTTKGSIVGAGTFTWAGGSLTTTSLLNIIATNAAGTAWVIVKAIDTTAFVSKIDYNYGGAFATVAAANIAITNAVGTNGKNNRDTKRVDIGTPGNYVTYWWKGGFADVNLVEYSPSGFKQWAAQAYTADYTVSYLGKYWRSNAVTLATDIPGTSTKWVEELTGYAKETTVSNALLYITDINGNILATYDSDGKFTAQYKEDSIPNTAFKEEVRNFLQGAEIVNNQQFLRLFTDSLGNILGGIKADGTHYFKSLETDNYIGLIPDTALKTEVQAFFKGAEIISDDKFLRLFADSMGNTFGGIKADGTLFFNSIEAENYKGNIVANQNDQITTATYLNFDFPESLVEVHVDGLLPTDQTDARTPTNVEVTFYKDNKTLFKCKAIMAIQGHGSINYIKKGYELDLKNANDKSLLVKWGNTPPTDGINFKAFHSDPTHTRDVSAGRLWKQIRTSRPFPSSFIADFTSDTTTNNTKYRYYDDALFYAEGFPMHMTANGIPFGLYTWRMKKKRENYRMDSANKNNIFLDLAGNTGVTFTSFQYQEWDLKSPKISKYEETMPITDATVLASINRFFDWMGGCLGGTINMRNTYADYINLDSIIDYIITCELIASWDADHNNVELMTWDGLHWNFCIYDQDHTAGIWFGDTKAVATNQVMTSPIWAKFKTVFMVEIKARYTELRNNGIINMNNIQKIYSAIPKTIPTDVYIENLALWGWSGQATWQTSLRDILDFLNQKIAHLDTIYKNN